MDILNHIAIETYRFLLITVDLWTISNLMICVRLSAVGYFSSFFFHLCPGSF